MPLLALVAAPGAGVRRGAPRAVCAFRASRSAPLPRCCVAGRYLLNPLFRIIASTGAGGDDRRGAVRRARLGGADAARRPVDGDGRLPGRRDACRIVLSATSSRPTSSRSAASCSACSSWPSACRSTSACIASQLGADPRRRAGPDGAQGGRHLRVVPRLRLPAMTMPCASRCLLPQGGEFAFVLFRRGGRRGIFDADTASLLIADRDAVDGADAVVCRVLASGCSARRRAEEDWRRISTAPVPTC